VYPNEAFGSGGGTVYNIDARGSNMSEAQFRAILADHQRQTLAMVPATVCGVIWRVSGGRWRPARSPKGSYASCLWKPREKFPQRCASLAYGRERTECYEYVPKPEINHAAPCCRFDANRFDSRLPRRRQRHAAPLCSRAAGWRPAVAAA